MAQVSSIIQGFHHLNDGNLAAEPRQVDANLNAHQPAADYYHIITGLFRVIIYFLRTEDVFTVNSRDVRYYRPCAEGRDDNVGAGLLREIRRYFGAGSYIYRHTGYHPRLVVQIFGKVFFKGDLFLTTERAAKTVALFAEDDFMPSLGSR